MKNYMKLQIPAIGENESFSRNAVAAFILNCSPTVEEINDIKTAVSEAVTNCVVHAYPNGGIIDIYCELDGKTLSVEVKDDGCGIENVAKAREPFFTTRSNEERSGMGFTVIETFMDHVEVESEVNKGTLVRMRKVLK